MKILVVMASGVARCVDVDLSSGRKCVQANEAGTFVLEKVAELTLSTHSRHQRSLTLTSFKAEIVFNVLNLQCHLTILSTWVTKVMNDDDSRNIDGCDFLYRQYIDS